jgi:hypothetical protein
LKYNARRGRKEFREMMRNRLLAAIVLTGSFAALSAHGQKASLTGTWKLNVASSFMGGDHPFPDYELTRKIAQSADTISITDVSVHNSVVNIPLPDATTTMEVAADGKEHEVQLPPAFPGRPPAKAQITATWQGCTLELLEINNGLSNYGKQRLFLSENGSQLIDLVETHSIYGDSEQRLVFDKTQ